MITEILILLAPIGIIKGFLLAWMFVNFEPLQAILNKRVVPVLEKKKMPYIAKSLSCHICASFWITLAITFNPFAAIAAGFIACTYARIINSFRTFI